MLKRWLASRFLPLSARQLRWVLNAYPPYLGAGIRVTYASEDFLRWDVEMRLRRSNQNYFGTHFGGSLYAMCDPFFALILTKKLGEDFIVWDRSAAIRFRRPGTTTVRARFELTEMDIEQIRAQAEHQRRQEPMYTVEVTNEAGQVVAEVDKHIYIRRTIRGSNDPRVNGSPLARSSFR